MELKHLIHINAAAETVWMVLEDIEQWPEWTPTIKSVKRMDFGAFDVGTTALIKQPGLPKARWQVTTLVRGERFTWESRLRGLRMIAAHEIQPVGNGTQSMLHLELSGFLAGLLYPLLRFSVQKALEQENKGLKERCEVIDREML